MRQDLTSLTLDVTADLATCHFDARNHFRDARVLRAAGLHLEKIRVVQPLKGRPIRKLSVAVRQA